MNELIIEPQINLCQSDSLTLSFDLQTNIAHLIWEDMQKNTHKLPIIFDMKNKKIVILTEAEYQNNLKKGKEHRKLINRLANLTFLDRLFWSIRGGLPE
jgi:hypothetical protein